MHCTLFQYQYTISHTTGSGEESTSVRDNSVKSKINPTVFLHKTTLVMMVWSKIWAGSCEHHDHLNVCTTKAWLHWCVMTRLKEAILDFLIHTGLYKFHINVHWHNNPVLLCGQSATPVPFFYLLPTLYVLYSATRHFRLGIQILRSSSYIYFLQQYRGRGKLCRPTTVEYATSTANPRALSLSNSFLRAWLK